MSTRSLHYPCNEAISCIHGESKIRCQVPVRTSVLHNPMKRRHRAHNAPLIAMVSFNVCGIVFMCPLCCSSIVDTHWLVSDVGVIVLDSVVVINEWYIFQSPAPETSCTAHTTHKLGISLRSLILRVACEHALDGHADTLHALDRRPACTE
jgi:hypothetical protein